MTQNGVNMDLVFVPVGGHACEVVANEKFGATSMEIGLLAVQAGMEATCEERNISVTDLVFLGY